MRLLITFMLMSVFVLVAGPAVALTGAGDAKAQEQEKFLDSPAKVLAEIYRDYHDWHVDSGIALSLSALEAVDVLYARSPRAAIADSSLKLNSAYQIKSTLHTMLGMLYYRKSLLVLRDSGTDAEKALMDKLENGGEVLEEDLEGVAEEAERGSSMRLMRDHLMSRAIAQFKLASDVDPSNPTPHYQMAAIYSAMPPVDRANLAEAEYYKGAQLSISEGQKNTALGALEAIRNINPASDYIVRLERLLAE